MELRRGDADVEIQRRNEVKMAATFFISNIKFFSED
jgi:hypothetical protein